MIDYKAWRSEIIENKILILQKNDIFRLSHRFSSDQGGNSIATAYIFDPDPSNLLWK